MSLERLTLIEERNRLITEQYLLLLIQNLHEQTPEFHKSWHKKYPRIPLPKDLSEEIKQAQKEIKEVNFNLNLLDQI